MPRKPNAVQPRSAIDCECQRATSEPRPVAQIEGFVELLRSCAALRCLVPPELEKDYISFCLSEPDGAHHIPIAFHAYRKGSVAALTRPLHEFCVLGESFDPRVRKQYRRDLAETWLRAPTVQEKFEGGRRLKGRLMEVAFASYLRSNGWDILGLEMWGEKVDIRACRSGTGTAFEVKHLGADQGTFDLTVEALSGTGVAVGSAGVYSPIDYLIFRIYEGARQLSLEPKPTIVAAVLDDYALNFELPLEEAWVDWQAPAFFRREADIEPLLEREYRKNPNLDEDLRREVSALTEIWFLEQVAPFTLERRVVEVNGTSA